MVLWGGCVEFEEPVEGGPLRTSVPQRQEEELAQEPGWEPCRAGSIRQSRKPVWQGQGRGQDSSARLGGSGDAFPAIRCIDPEVVTLTESFP